MSFSYTYQKIKNQTVFQGIGSKDFAKGQFFAVISIEGMPYLLDDLFYSEANGRVWDVQKANVYHYTVPQEEGGVYTCSHCQYEYETGKEAGEEVKCRHYSREPFLTALWGACVFSERFEETFRELLQEWNPCGLAGR